VEPELWGGSAEVADQTEAGAPDDDPGTLGATEAVPAPDAGTSTVDVDADAFMPSVSASISA